jgi:hypothetical protein
VRLVKNNTINYGAGGLVKKATFQAEQYNAPIEIGKLIV